LEINTANLYDDYLFQIFIVPSRFKFFKRLPSTWLLSPIGHTHAMKRSVTVAFAFATGEETAAAGAETAAGEATAAAGAEELSGISMEKLKEMTAEQLRELNVKQLEELKAMNDAQLENLKGMGMEKLQELKKKLVQEMDAAHNEVCKIDDDWFHASKEERTPEAEEKRQNNIELLNKRIFSISSITNAIRSAYIELRDKRTDDAIEAHAAKKLKGEEKAGSKDGKAEEAGSKGAEAGVEKTGVEKTEKEKTDKEKKQDIIAAMKLFGLAKLNDMTEEVDRQKLKLANEIWDLREEWKDSLDETKEAGAKEAGTQKAGAKKVKAKMSPKDYEEEIKTLQDKICWFSKEEDNLWEAIIELKKEVKRELFPQ
jgi:hypothetical protein